MSHYSIVEYFAEHEGYRCGYCKSLNTNYSHGMWAHSLTVDDYQKLIDRGWRRSGKYCYKPTMSVTCCPTYTIKCNALDFRLSKSQKKVLKTMRRFLTFGRKEKAEEMHETRAGGEQSTFERGGDFIDSACIQRLTDRVQLDLDARISMRENPKVSRNDRPSIASENVSRLQPVQMDTDASCSELLPAKGLGADTNKPICKKAKLLRQERRLQKMMKKNNDLSCGDLTKLAEKKNKLSAEPKTLEDFLDEPPVENSAHKLEVRLVVCDTKCREFEKTFVSSYAAYASYQMAIHGETKEECDIKMFTDFLVTSPLEEEDASSSASYGSFHQQYWLDDKLIAVGVIDILPKCVSSVYLFYDPEYSFLSLGSYAALREVAFVRKLNRIMPDLKYYYMGFYIHSCLKMRYKANFKPSYLLCPETYNWHPYEKCKLKLDIAKYSRLEDDTKKADEDGEFNEDRLLVLYNKRVTSYATYRLSSSKDDKEEVRQYARLVGCKCYTEMLLYRS